MAISGTFGPEKVVNNILKTVNSKKGGSSVKHIVGRHQVMHKILEKSFETASTNGINYETCFQFFNGGFKHQNGDVRNQAYLGILEVYRVLGKAKMRTLLQHSGLRGA